MAQTRREPAMLSASLIAAAPLIEGCPLVGPIVDFDDTTVTRASDSTLTITTTRYSVPAIHHGPDWFVNGAPIEQPVPAADRAVLCPEGTGTVQ